MQTILAAPPVLAVDTMCCPCCGTVVPVEFYADLNSNRISYGEKTVQAAPQVVEFMYLLRMGYPGVVKMSELSDGLWGNNSSDRAYRHIQVLVLHARKIGRSMGFTIENTRKRGYKLVLPRAVRIFERPKKTRRPS